MDARVKFLLIGNKNAITYKETFPLIKNNQVWVGAMPMGQDLLFTVPDAVAKAFLAEGREGSNYRIINGKVMGRAAAVWFTNIDHGKRHEPLQFMTAADCLRYAPKLKGRGLTEYERYDNYDAIEVPATKAIPSDHPGIMGVPISFLDKFCPEQFEIVGMGENEDLYEMKTRRYTSDECKSAYFDKFGKKGVYDLNASGVVLRDGRLEKVYQRIFIRHTAASLAGEL